MLRRRQSAKQIDDVLNGDIREFLLTIRSVRQILPAAQRLRDIAYYCANAIAAAWERNVGPATLSRNKDNPAGFKGTAFQEFFDKAIAEVTVLSTKVPTKRVKAKPVGEGILRTVVEARRENIGDASKRKRQK